MDHHLIDIIACPVCHGKLILDKENQEFICKTDRLAYPIEKGIPVMLEIKARKLKAMD